jgi:hypothetical protein
MRNCFVFSLLFGLIFTIFHCTEEITVESFQPSPVVLIPGVADTCRVEKGMDAIPEADAIRLEWIPSSEEEVSGYAIYRGDEEGNSYNLVTVQSVPDSSFEDESVSLDTRYHYYVRAVTDEGTTSVPSDTLNYMLIEKAIRLMPMGTTDSPRPDFSWEDPNTPPKAYYVVRLVEVASGHIVWISMVPSSYSNRETAPFNADGTASTDSLVTGVAYQWRVDVVGSEDCSGSESSWVTFTVE